MIASLLSPAPAPKERMSQMLPSVKCSSCNQPVPLSELGEHICTSPPPVPAIPRSTPTPPPRQGQGRTASPSPSVRSQRPSPPRQDAPAQQSSSSSRLRINTVSRGPPSPTQPTFKSSPLARTDSGSSGGRQDTSSPRPRDPPFPTTSSTSSPLRTRMRAGSNAASIRDTPSTARPSVSFNKDTTPVQTTPSRPPFSNAPPPPRGLTPQPAGLPSGPGQARPPSRNASSTPGPSMNGPPPPTNGVPFPRGPPPPPGSFNGGPPPPMGYPGRPGPSGMGSMPPAPPSMGPRQMGPPNGMGPRMASFPPVRPEGYARPEEAFVHPAERGINTKSGGEAGMAGVGRRGFAAAARAAMVVAPAGRPMGPPQGSQPQYNRKPNAPQYLDLDATSRPSETPPLSPGSGYSSHSPGPTSPLQQSDFVPGGGQGAPAKIQRTPSPSGPFISTNTPSKPPNLTLPLPTNPLDPNNVSISSPLSPRLPFFEKFKNKLPGNSPSAEVPPALSSSTNDNNRSANNTPMNNTAMRQRADTMLTTSSSSMSGSSASRSGLGGPGGPNGSSPFNRQRSRSNAPPPTTARHPLSPTSGGDSESEYSGLAYADSTDYEDDEPPRGRQRSPPPPLPGSVPLTKSVLRSISNNSKVQFGSVSGRSRSNDSRTGLRIGRTGGANGRDGSLSRADSVSSYSSAASSERGGGVLDRIADRDGDLNRERERSTPERPTPTRARSNSSAIAQALGLSQTPPSEYSKLGGPGMKNRESSRLVARTTSTSSNGSRAAYSRGDDKDGDVPPPVPEKPSGLGSRSGSVTRVGRTGAIAASASSAGGPTLRERSLSRQRQEADQAILASSSKAAMGIRSMSKERAVLRERERGMSREREREMSREREREMSKERQRSRDRGRDLERERRLEEEQSVLGVPGGLKAQRSNTVQGVQSPDVKPIKLPARAQSERESGSYVPKKERARKVRVCLKCAKSVDDGRWVQVDGGGVLCEKCWKNMYLPKCRRCNLPIERAAVSSSDGQLKGKYHRECFNCHKCHKPFPDKSFYVYDGKPLCAYHYHEANDSLCAAALCGQPIEGPCAVSHTGDRYHPEHMTCEYPGYPACKERLDEYWEVDGRMLCERHAVYATRRGAGGDGEEWASTSKAMKRVTRFIDLTGGMGGGPGRDSVEESGLR